MALICKTCGFKQYDTSTIEVYRSEHPGVEEHDIPYCCGACQDNSNDGTEQQEYIVTITEVLQQKVPVKAESREDAEYAVECDYRRQKHILTAEDFIGVSFKAKPYKGRSNDL